MNTVDMKTISLLVDTIIQYQTKFSISCEDCVAHDVCFAKLDGNMRGTECHAIITIWAGDTVRETMTRTMKRENMCSCILDGCHGVYIPKLFAESFNWDIWNISKLTDAKQALLAGPYENSYIYWEYWNDVLENAWMEDPDTGLYWRLYQDSDLFMVVDGYFERFGKEN